MKLVKIDEIKGSMKKTDQLKMLNDMIQNPPSTSRVVEFTPELAEHILTNLNYKNRPSKSAKIIQYARDMEADRWLLTGETIAFGSDGLLKDGQNRLAACIRAGASFKTHCMFGIDPLAFAVMDTGANRSHSDILSIMGVRNASKVTSLLKLYYAWRRGHTNTGRIKITNEEMRNWFVDSVDEEAAQRSANFAALVNNVTNYPNGHIGALYYHAAIRGEEDLVIEFLEPMRTGTSKARSPQKVLMKHVTAIKSNPSYTLSSHDYAVLLCRAWYCFKNKINMTKAELVVLTTDKLPKI